MSGEILHLAEPLSNDEFDHIQKWYEDECSDAQYAARHDCHVVRALRELRRAREALCHTHGVRGCTHPDHWGIAS